MGLFSRKKRMPQTGGAETRQADKPEGSSASVPSAEPGLFRTGQRSSAVSRQELPAHGNSKTVETSPEAEKASATEEKPKAKPKKPGFFLRHFPDTDWGMVRITFVFACFLVLFLGLWCRAWYLQMIEGPKLAEYARRQHITTELVTGRRGMILDRDGQVLARSVEALSVYANPKEIVDPLSVANSLGPIIGVAPQKLYDQLKGTRRHFLWLKRKVDDYTAAAVRKAALPGIGLSKEYERVYPFKHMCGQLLGFVGYDDKGLP